MEVQYDINRPWLTLDPWQIQYIYKTPPNQSCFLLCGRQVGKTTAMSIKAVELCVKHFKKGDLILINSITEKQAYHLLAKALIYAKALYPKLIITKGADKPTKHKLMFKNKTGILCYAAGETGEGLRGFTIKKLMSDEGSRMSEEYFIAVSPMMSVISGSRDIASTPAGKLHTDGTIKYFYKCSTDKKFKKFYVSAEDCPRHTEEFLADEKERLSRLAYAQEYLAIFTDELRRIFDEDWVKKVCVLKRREEKRINRDYFLGVDVAAMGEDESTFEILDGTHREAIEQVENITTKKTRTTDTTNKILFLNKHYDFRQIGVDSGGLGVGVCDQLVLDDDVKRKVVELNNASRVYERYGDGIEVKERKKKLLKEDMYFTLQAMGENGEIKLLDDDEVKESLASIQHDEGKIFGFAAHIAEGLIRAARLAKSKSLNPYVM